MQINENINLYATISIKNGEQEIPAVNVNSNIMQNGSSFNVSVNVINPEVTNLNLEYVQAEIDNFMNNLRSKLSQSNYKISI